MDSNISPSGFAISALHEELVFSICTNLGVSGRVDPVEEASPDVAWVKALWDTGANSSCISGRLARQLGLEVADYVHIITASSREKVPTHFVNLEFSNGMKFFKIEVAQYWQGGDGSDFIVGMDIITQGDFSITNFQGQTLFSFRIPSLHSIDYEAEWLRQQE